MSERRKARKLKPFRAVEPAAGVSCVLLYPFERKVLLGLLDSYCARRNVPAEHKRLVFQLSEEITRAPLVEEFDDASDDS